MTASPDSGYPPASSQPGRSAYLNARAWQSGAHAIVQWEQPVSQEPLSPYRKEELRGLEIVAVTTEGPRGWRVFDEGRTSGTWLAEHTCHATQEVDLSSTTMYAPKCKWCGEGAPCCNVRDARNRHEAMTGAMRAGRSRYRRN
jgi:hypothetical protein